MRRLLAFFLGTGFCVLILFSAEKTCGILLRKHGSVRWMRPGEFRPSVPVPRTPYGIFPDPPSATQKLVPAPVVNQYSGKLQSRFIPHSVYRFVGDSPFKLPTSSYRSIRFIAGGGPVIWDLEYKIDAFRRRDTPGESAKTGAERFVLLLGDSCIFGEGVKEEETLASQLGFHLSRERVYNYGIPGLFPGELLDWMRLVQGPPEIREPRGSALYFFSDYHIHRHLGSIVQVGSWGYSRPYYSENESGDFVSTQSFEKAWPVWTKLARWAFRSNIVRYFRLDWPAAPRDEDWRRYAKLIQQVKRETERLGSDRFYVVFSPNTSSRYAAILAPLLAELKIRYIDLSGWRMEFYTQGPAFIAHDGHPTGENHRVLGEALSRILREQAGRLE